MSQLFHLRPAVMAEGLRKDKCPANLGVFDKDGKATLVSIFLLPEHEAAAKEFVAALHAAAGYTDPNPR